MRQIASSNENVSIACPYLDLPDLYIRFSCCLILHCIYTLQFIYLPSYWGKLRLFLPWGNECCVTIHTASHIFQCRDLSKINPLISAFSLFCGITKLHPKIQFTLVQKEGKKKQSVSIKFYLKEVFISWLIVRLNIC